MGGKEHCFAQVATRSASNGRTPWPDPWHHRPDLVPLDQVATHMPRTPRTWRRSTRSTHTWCAPRTWRHLTRSRANVAGGGEGAGGGGSGGLGMVCVCVCLCLCVCVCVCECVCVCVSVCVRV